jgi:hypothetical protein
MPDELYTLIPPVRNDTPRGKHGFTIRLEGGFARRAFQINLLADYYRGIQAEGREIITGYDIPECSRVQPPYSFVASKKGARKNISYTGLLRFCSVPGNDNGISADNEQIGLLIGEGELRVLEYKSMGVNDQIQAEALKALWTHWFEKMKKVLGS